MMPHMAAWLFPAWAVTVILAGAAGAWIAWPMAFDRGFEEAVGPQERHRHRAGGPQETALLELPRAGQLALEPAPEPEWAFFGASVRTGPAEYELMTRAGPDDPFGPDAWRSHQPGCGCPDCAANRAGPDETPSAWTRREGEKLARDIDEMIAKAEQARRELVEKSNYFQHTILAEHPPMRGGRGDGTR